MSEIRRRGDRPWAVMLNSEAIARGAKMGSNLFHLQIILEEGARTNPYTWLSVAEIARRMDRSKATVRRLISEWEGSNKGGAKYGKRVIEGKANDLLGIVLFFRLDESMPAARPETFDAVVGLLKADRFKGRTPLKNKRGKEQETDPYLAQHQARPMREIDRAPSAKVGNRIITDPEGERKEEPSVSQSGDDRLTDDSLSLSREEWGPEDGPEKICQLVGLLSRLPGECRKAAIDPKNRRFFEGRWIDLAKALIIAAEPERRRNAVQNGVGYLRKLMGKPDELKHAGAALGQFLDGTMAATMAARAEREAEFRAALKAEEEAEEEAERARKKQGPAPPIPTPPKVEIVRTSQFCLAVGMMPMPHAFFDVALKQFRDVDVEETVIAETIVKECESMMESQRFSHNERPGYLIKVQAEIDLWRERRKRARERKPPEMPDWCKPPHLRRLAGR